MGETEQRSKSRAWRYVSFAVSLLIGAGYL